MAEQTDVRELREKIERADQMVTNLCKPRYTPNAREWTMSIPARPDHDPDLVIGAGLDAGRAALERLEKLEAELRLCRSFHEVAVRQRDTAWSEARALRAYYEAAEQAEYAGRQLGTAAQAQAARRLEIARAALRATPAPAPQQGGAE